MSPAPLTPEQISIEVTSASRRVTGLYLRPDNADALFIFGHGAGAGMTHPFMDSMAHRLARCGIATLRYQFPYMEHGGKRPDARPLLLQTVRSAVEAGRTLRDSLPLFAGGKSMGGRMASLAAAERQLPGVEGIVFLGFPLHPPGSPSSERARHLKDVEVPMLFLQGDRDKLGDLTLLKPAIRKLGKRATLRVIEGADHSFHVLRSTGKDDDEILAVLCDHTLRLISEVLR